MSHIKKYSLLLICALLLGGCSTDDPPKETGTETNEVSSPETVPSVPNTDASAADETDGSLAETAPSAEPTVDELAIEWKAKDLYTNYLDGIRIDLSAPRSGEGFTVREDIITVTEEGTYILSGILAEGQVIVDAPKDADVRLVLENASIHSTDASPIEVKTADKVIISLPAGTENTLSNDPGADFETVDIAGILSKEDLTVNGTGKLTVSAGSGDGIRSKDTLKITGGELIITAADRGLVGKDSVEIMDANADITAEGDGIKSNNDEEPEKGYIYIEGGTFRIRAQKDGIQAETALHILGGTFDITTGTGSFAHTGGESFGMGGGRGGMGGFGGKGSFEDWFGTTDGSTDESESQKGLKAGTAVRLSGGTVTLDTYDDAIHSDGDVTLAGGMISAATGDDGIHAEGTVTISGGALAITQSYEGIEGKIITMTDGTVAVTASDDGLNATDGTGDTMGMFSRGEEGEGAEVLVTISGGSLYVDAQGDGLDSNGTFTIDGGTVIVNGPADGANGYVDTAGSFTVNGGTYLGIGTSQMLVTPSASSAQMSVVWSGNVGYDGGSTVEIRDEDGNTLFAAESARRFNSVSFSSPELTADTAYDVVIGGDTAASVTAGAGSGSGFGGFGGFGGGGKGSFGGGRGERPIGGNRTDGGETFADETTTEVATMPEDGTMPEMPTGGMRPEMPEGGWNGGTPPEMPEDGTMPEMPTGGMRPEMPDGGWNGGTPPEMPEDGTMPEMPTGGMRPEMPEGGWNGGTPPERPTDDAAAE